MFTNHIKTALRFLKHNKVFAGLNALGLSIALAVSFLILLYVINELSVNHGHSNLKRIYRVNNRYTEMEITMARTPFPLGPAMKHELPGIDKTARVGQSGSFELKTEDTYTRILAYSTDADIFDIFTLPLIRALPRDRLLADRDALVLSRSIADKVFPGKNPLGKEVIVRVNGKEASFTVTGVFEDPENSTFMPEALVNSIWSVDFTQDIIGLLDAETNWNYDFWTTWILVSQNCRIENLKEQFAKFKKTHLGETPKQYQLQNLANVYLNIEKVTNSGLQGNLGQIRLFLAIALVIVLIAAFNYIILATTISTNRTREIAIRKTFGASAGNIGRQMLGESLILAILVFPVALIMAYFVLPRAAQLFQTQLHILKSNVPLYAVVYTSLILLIGLVSGIYTSFYLSRLKVWQIMKNTPATGHRKQLLQSILIFIQLVLFCGFVSGAMLIRSQYRFAMNKDTGFEKKNILTVDLGMDSKVYPALLAGIHSIPDVIDATGVMEGLPMMGYMTYMVPNFQDPDKQVKMEALAFDYDFVKTMGLKVIQGRDFSREFGSDLTQSVLVNETAVKQLGMIDPIGMKIGDQIVIGVVKDFNLHSVRTDIPPMTLSLTDQYNHELVIRYKPGTLNRILYLVEKEWKRTGTDQPFSYSTIENKLKMVYSQERNLARVVFVSTLFTLLIALFGLFGMTLFTAQMRTREISIRRVFGSSVKDIIFPFLGKYLLLTVIASLVSVLLTRYFILKWLQQYAYKTTINGWIFVLAFTAAIVVVILTVSLHAVKAARNQPAEVLRYE
jgi:putative ABC transport system permease protein